ncbi:hypothetical protein MUP77_11870 [Candidatus Bathyarchaeota archaeon]|nr:hypothetical protein [Candidatus Bathyarchaeota archaeon]
MSDEVHRKLTATLGTLMAQTGKMRTYQDAIEAMLGQSAILPPEQHEQLNEAVKEMSTPTIAQKTS